MIGWMLGLGGGLLCMRLLGGRFESRERRIGCCRIVGRLLGGLLIGPLEVSLSFVSSYIACHVLSSHEASTPGVLSTRVSRSFLRVA
jgi:hypothetical protein